MIIQQSIDMMRRRKAASQRLLEKNQQLLAKMSKIVDRSEKLAEHLIKSCSDKKIKKTH